MTERPACDAVKKMGLVTASSINFDLRPLDRVIGYWVYDIMDTDVADIRDLLVDEETRKPRYAVIEIGGLLSIKGKKVLLPWAALEKAGMSRMDIACPIEQIIAAPAPLDPAQPKRQEEESIHWFFNAKPYWLSEKEKEADEAQEESEAPGPGPGPAPQNDTPLPDLTIESNDEEARD